MKSQVIRFLAICILSCSSLLTLKAQQSQQPATVNQHEQMTPEQRVDMRVNKMKQELNLTDEQATKVKELYLSHHKANKEAQKEAAQNNRAKMADKLSKILTPEQMTKLKQMRKEHKQPMGASPKEQNTQGQ